MIIENPRRRKTFLAAVIVILLLIALAEGIVLLHHSIWYDKLFAAKPLSFNSFFSSQPGRPNPAKYALPEKEDVNLQATAEDIERMHNQINRLFREMTRDTALARQNFHRQHSPFMSMDHIQRLQDEIEQIFRNALEERHSGALSLLEKDWRDVAVTSSVNIKESGTNYVIIVSMPGFQKDEINVSLRGQILAIEAGTERRESADNSRLLGSGCFKTQIMLPSEAKGESAEASYENGLLKVIIPKKAAGNSLAHKVQIM